MGNIGDSRAIMGSKDRNDSMVAIQLTVDLKPDLPSKSNENIIDPFCSCFLACC
jgi:serine/threonine protein phosphatase PrpC